LAAFFPVVVTARTAFLAVDFMVVRFELLRVVVAMIGTPFLPQGVFHDSNAASKSWASCGEAYLSRLGANLLSRNEAIRRQLCTTLEVYSCQQ
jgi:hypothetical protein